MVTMIQNVAYKRNVQCTRFPSQAENQDNNIKALNLKHGHGMYIIGSKENIKQ